MRQHLSQRSAHRAVPALHQRCVHSQTPERPNTPVPVYENQRAFWLPRRSNTRHHLASLLNRVGQSLHGRRIHNAGSLKSQFHSVQIHLHCARRWAMVFRVTVHGALHLNGGWVRLALRDATSPCASHSKSLARTSGNAAATPLRRPGL